MKKFSLVIFGTLCASVQAMNYKESPVKEILAMLASPSVQQGQIPMVQRIDREFNTLLKAHEQSKPHLETIKVNNTDAAVNASKRVHNKISARL